MRTTPTVAWISTRASRIATKDKVSTAALAFKRTYLGIGLSILVEGLLGARSD